MSKPIKAALTAEEWAMPFVEFCHERIGFASSVVEDIDLGEVVPYLTVDGEVGPQDRVALAARWLHEQGWLTHEDVARCREAARNMGDQYGPGTIGEHKWRSLASRIAALLPPEGV